jgi:riboflavin biosynthesis pyrimidine reductase
MTDRFQAYCRRKEQAALAAVIPGYTTREDTRPPGMVSLGNPWSCALFDGAFYRNGDPRVADTPITSLVFVQSRDGNTATADPSTLGGGATDLHVVYEGLSRVDADAVLAGAATAKGKDMVFSLWHPELVSLRLARGRSRHPAQVLVTDRGDLRFDDGLMFQEPELRVFVITRTSLAEGMRRRVQHRPWIDVVDAGEPVSLTRAFRYLRNRGIAVLSCVGGRRTATGLIREDLVSDIYLTTSAIEAGEPGTPFYEGPPLSASRILLKAGRGPEQGVKFEHLLVNSAFPSPNSQNL